MKVRSNLQGQKMKLREMGARVCHVMLLGAWGLLALTDAQAEVRYTVVNLGTEMMVTLPDAVPAISNTGLVVGTDSYPAIRGYIWEDGQVTRIEPAYQNATTTGFGVNASGAVVGTTLGPGYNGPIVRPFIYQNGTLNYIPDVIPNAPNVNARAAYAINDAGAAVGEWESRPFIYANGVSRWLEGSVNAAGNLATLGVAKDINNKGWAVGTMSYQGATGAVVWHDGIAVDLGTLPVLDWQHPDASANAINDLNEVVGVSRSALGMRAFLWRDGQMIDLGSFRGDGWSSRALDVNNRSEVVGRSDCVGLACAFLWTRQEGMLQLQNFIDPTSGWTLDTATGINDMGWIVGNGLLNGVSADFLLIPVPEPSTSGMLVTGLLLAFAVSRRRTPAAR